MSRRFILLCLLLALLPLSAGAVEGGQQMERFIAEMASRHGFDRAQLEQLLRGARIRQDIIDAMNRPAEAKPWYQYRPIFLTRDRIAGGVRYWQANRETLDAVRKTYGVPPEIVVAIIGVETRYGAHMGKYPVLDALSTLAFHYPKRGAFFRGELEQFLLLAREERLSPTRLKGSYAGALGKPQFIPSSYRRYAVDFDGDRRRDLWHSDADVIASVANYFQRHGWRPGSPIAVRARGVEARHRRFVALGMKPATPVKVLRAAGIRPVDPLPGDLPASLVELERGKGRLEYWLGLPNFYVITRYNHSNLYAMAVFQLSREIAALKEMEEKGLAQP